MKQRYGMRLIFLEVLAIALLCLPIRIKAEEEAVFYVQTADVLQDGKEEVCVYLDNAKNLGGIDCVLHYDPQKVSFVSSCLGTSLSSNYSDIYHDIEKSEIHYVILYPSELEAHGVLLKAVFQLKEGDAYQPELIVNDIVDNSDEINAIPYIISYQQSDGTWEAQQDESQKAADPEVIQSTLEQYGAEEDKKEDGAASTVTVSADNQISNVWEDTEIEKETEIKTEMKTGSSWDKKPIILLCGILVLLIAVVIGCLILDKKKKG